MKDAMQLQAARIRRCFLTLTRTEFGIPSSERAQPENDQYFSNGLCETVGLYREALWTQIFI
jgi:hypothetical protein